MTYPSECSKIHKPKLVCPHGHCSDSLVPPLLLYGVSLERSPPLSSPPLPPPVACSHALGSLYPLFLFFLFKLSWEFIAIFPKMHLGKSLGGK
jgi:hypothetical protein